MLWKTYRWAVDNLIAHREPSVLVCANVGIKKIPCQVGMGFLVLDPQAKPKDGRGLSLLGVGCSGHKVADDETDDTTD